jgi:hypothetical protein
VHLGLKLETKAFESYLADGQVAFSQRDFQRPFTGKFEELAQREGSAKMAS